MNTPVVDRVIEQLRALPDELQWRVLEFTRALATSATRGVPGQQLLRFAGTIPSNDLQLMHQAIEQGCEQADANEWFDTFDAKLWDKQFERDAQMGKFDKLANQAIADFRASKFKER